MRYSRRITLSMKADFKARIAAVAKKRGLTMSEFVRRVMWEETSRVLRESRPPNHE